MQNIWKNFIQLKSYVENEDFKGWDPYDGLNSKLFKALPIVRNSRFFKLVWIQLFKKNPINLRSLVGIKKEHNAKGLALFISGYVLLHKQEPENPQYLKTIESLSDQLINMRNSNYTNSCWGYNFDWQARAFFQPKNTPTVVATSYAGQALLDAYAILKKEQYLNVAKSAAKFICEDLNRTHYEDGTFTYSYSPLDKTQVINAGLLGVRLLSQIAKYDNSVDYQGYCRPVVEFAIKLQKPDGSWPYGTLPFHQWIDNFHTGFNLECLYEYQSAFKDSSFSENIQLGLTFYLNNLFTEQGEPKYYNNSLYPIDLHSPAQLLVTLSKLECFNEHRDQANKVLNWTISHMQRKSGSFFFYRYSWITNKISYMRWTQAWMFLGMSHYFSAFPEARVS